MTGQPSNFLKIDMLNHYFRGDKKLYLHLYISDPTDNDIGTEVTGGNYEPEEITFAEPTLVQVQVEGESVTKGQIQNDSLIVFNTATDNWQTISHFGIRDEDDNLLASAPVPTPKLIEQGDEAKWNVGAITLRMF